MPDWLRSEKLHFTAFALLMGLVVGGLLTYALGVSTSEPSRISERSDADAIASDQAAPTPTATAGRCRSSCRSRNRVQGVESPPS